MEIDIVAVLRSMGLPVAIIFGIIFATGFIKSFFGVPGRWNQLTCVAFGILAWVVQIMLDAILRAAYVETFFIYTFIPTAVYMWAEKYNPKIAAIFDWGKKDEGNG